MIPIEWMLINMGIVVWVVVCSVIWGLHWGTYYAESDGTIKSRIFAEIGGWHVLIKFPFRDVQEHYRDYQVAMPLRGALIAAAIGLGLISSVWFVLSIMTNIFPSHRSVILILFSGLIWLIVSVISTNAFTLGANLPGVFIKHWPESPYMPMVMSTILVGFALLVQWHYFEPETVKQILGGIYSVEDLGYGFPAIPLFLGACFWTLHPKYFQNQCPWVTRMWYSVSIAVFSIPSVILGLIINSWKS